MTTSSPPALAVHPKELRACGCACISPSAPEIDYSSDDDFCRCVCHVSDALPPDIDDGSFDADFVSDSRYHYVD